MVSSSASIDASGNVYKAKSIRCCFFCRAVEGYCRSIKIEKSRSVIIMFTLITHRTIPLSRCLSALINNQIRAIYMRALQAIYMG